MFGSKTQELHAPPSSHRFHNILAPISPNSINIQSSAGQLTKKRKYSDVSTKDGLGGPFDIKAPSSSLSKDSLRLIPRLLISRLHLPLAFLEPIKIIGGSYGAQLFSAKIPVLESHLSQNGNLNGPTVLIAGSDSSSSLYAVEKAGDGIYALCKLSACVTLADLESNLQYRTQTKTKRYERRTITGNEWWHAAAIGGDGILGSNESKKQKLKNLEKIQLCLTPPLPEIPSATSSAENPSLATSEQVASTLEKMVDEEPLQLLSKDPDEIFDMLRSNYQEALYKSQVSLAYFAKGPLSRARAFFQNNVASPPSALQLPEFLRNCVLNLPVLDKKYKETLPEIVNGLPAEVLTDDESGAFIEALRRKSRRSKKSKIGKNGLYPEEEISIAKWWISRNNSLNVSDLIRDKEDGRDKARILLQKAREIHLQIILVLETLALEISASKAGTQQNGPEDVAKNQIGSVKEQKTKKPKDLQILLDLLIDRLCIWQSMNNDEVVVAMNEKENTNRNSGKQESGPSNLRDFCIDVVLPFYSARLPDLSTKLCQKLGGPKQPSPKRPPLSKAAAYSQALVKPGASLQRHHSLKSRRTLERVLTDDKIASRKSSPALSRSATDSMLPSLKREVSDKSMSSIPLNKVPFHKLRRYSQREVDLSTISQANEARLNKKAGVEKELQSAIAALKRPNPRMAVKELVEDAEKRTASSGLQKTKNPTKKRFTQGVQVLVTPSVNRRKDVFSGLPRLPQPSQVVLPELEDIPPSSGLRVIASTPRVRANEINNRIQHRMPLVEQTPTRGSSKFARPITYTSLDVSQHNVTSQNFITPTKAQHSFNVPSMFDGIAFSSTNKSGKTTVANSSILNEGNSSQGVQDTPLKVSVVQPAETLQQLPSSVKIDEGDRSIYEKLGWDDDIDELL